MTENEKQERRKLFFKKFNEDYPPVRDFVITSSGIVEPMPEDEAEWEIFNECLKYPET